MTGLDRGILYPARLPRFTRSPAPDRVTELVRWFWIPEWDVEPGRVSRQHVVAFPASNLVVDSRDGGFVGFAGPTTRRSHQDLRGSGWAVGAQLRPAAVPAFTADPAAVRDAYLRLDEPELFEAVAGEMTAGSGGRRSPERLQRAVDEVCDWLARRVGPVPAEARTANAMAELVDGDPTVVRVEDAASRLAVSPRTLHRLAHRYVGLAPAAMIRRRRLQEAAERVRTDRDADIATIAADLGYADHAHLTRDFRAVLGLAPSDYRREQSG